MVSEDGVRLILSQAKVWCISLSLTFRALSGRKGLGFKGCVPKTVTRFGALESREA
jgi:hypothetical protein